MYQVWIDDTLGLQTSSLERAERAFHEFKKQFHESTVSLAEKINGNLKTIATNKQEEAL